MTDMSDEFKDLEVLDSPLLKTLAPELLPVREAVLAAVNAGTASGCSSCQKRAMFTKLAELQTQLQDLVEGSPDLQQVLPQLIASAKVTK